MKSKFYLGLDIGTSSCGWAATDENYNLLRAKGKDLWGAHLFDEAEDAVNRRIHRSSRRRLERRKQRIDLLQDLFKEEMAKKDETFFLRLNNSRLWAEDKPEGAKAAYLLFNEENFNDKIYYEKYKTIYHLRMALINGEKEALSDIRLVYLALHHIIKYRGNFLKEGQELSKNGFTSSEPIKKVFTEFNGKYNELLEEEVLNVFDSLHIDKIVDVITRVSGIKKAKDELKDFAPTTKPEKEIFSSMISLMLGGKAKVFSLFPSLEEDGVEDISFTFNDSKYEESVSSEVSGLTGDFFKIVEDIKSIYDWISLRKILNDSPYISQAMINTYNRHHEDLMLLKEIVKNDKDLKKSIFDYDKSDKISSYAKYIGHYKKGGKKISCRKCSREDFVKYIAKTIEGIKAPELQDKKTKILSLIEEGTFLQTKSTTISSVVPYQVHEIELRMILRNAERVYPFLSSKNQTPTASEKIMSIFKFKIPYYVGPLNSTKPEFSWVVRNSKEKVYPWNFSKIIDENASAQNFITRMTNKCTFLVGKDVLAKNSLAYLKYLVLNDLNNTTIKGEKITQEAKKNIFDNLFKKHKKVSIKSIVKLFDSDGKKGLITENDILLPNRKSEYDFGLTSYLDFVGIFKSNQFDEDFAERAIFLSTVFNNPTMVRNSLEKEFPKINKEIISRVSKLSYSGWGRISKEMFDGHIEYFDNAGNPVSILKTLEDTTQNFMQIINNPDYEIKKQIREMNDFGEVVSGELTYEAIKELNISPLVKRGAWRASKIINELVEVIGKQPDKIFVEVTRRNEESKLTKSRRNIILEKYKECKEMATEINNLKITLESKNDDQLRGDALFLYFMQLGKCMYSGEDISIEDLADSTKYDIDHIIPQSMKKDDSLENRVLVKRVINQKEKRDIYPLPLSLQNESNKSFWKHLLDKGFIGKEKWNRLTRTSPITDEELSEFISRQLVVTDQSNIVVIDLIKKYFPHSEVYFSKAGYVSEFRNKYNFYKCRDINDLHHANDAYLNIVVANTVYANYGTDFERFVKTKKENEKKTSANIMHIFDRLVFNAWNPNSSIAIVKETMSKHSPLITRMPIIQTGDFYEQNKVCGKEAKLPATEDKNNPLIDKLKYGGYSSGATSYFVVVDYDGKKGKRERAIVAIPIMYSKRCLESKEFLLKTLAENGYKNPILPDGISTVPMNSHILVKGSDALLCGVTNDSLIISSFVQPFFSNEAVHYFKGIEKMVLRYSKNEKRIDEINTKDCFMIADNKEGTNKFFISKQDNLKLYKEITRTLSKKAYQGLSIYNFNIFLSESEGIFVNLPLFYQSKLLIELVGLVTPKKGTADLSIINGSKHAGGMNIKSSTDGIILIADSITGIFVRKIKLT